MSTNALDRPAAALTLSQSQALAAVLAGAVAVDGVLGTEEARRLNEMLAATRWMLGLGDRVVGEAAKQGLDLIAQHGLAAVLKASADAIPPDLRPTTFALAVDLVLADGRLGSRENTFIDQLQTALQIEGDLARNILDVLLIKNRASGRPDVYPIVTALQGVFAENWLECSGEILIGPCYWPQLSTAGSTEAMLVKSSPSDRATASRVVFQMLIEGAAREIAISTPYFLPDRSLRQALARAAQRGVRVRILVPGRFADQRLVRLASRRMYQELLDAGIRLFEYRPAMMHAKALMVDKTWAVLGTTNVDNRSFEHNDEVNVAFRDPAITERLLQDFESDLAVSDEITSLDWSARPVVQKLVEPVCWILERQQ